MVYLLTDHIITPLGEGVSTNLTAISQGQSQLRSHIAVHGQQLATPVIASLLEEKPYLIDGYTLFESYCIHAIQGALDHYQIDCTSQRCVFILSSTKGEIWCSMYDTALHIAQHFNNPTRPVVVSTACTSGVSAQITAFRLIESGLYDTAVVVGCDVQSEFIVSGFQCFHALSSSFCTPFDRDRDGLNAGEAVACMILGNAQQGLGWQLLGGSIHNDANHISGPSRTAEGSLRCLNDALQLVDTQDLACISVHGTGTIYNDEMESIALHRAGLDHVPVSALKGYYGHTMGAAGLLETILCLHALSEQHILPTKGYMNEGTTYPLSIASSLRPTNQRSLIKLLSGFGGVNAQVAWSLNAKTNEPQPTNPTTWRTIASYELKAPTDSTAMYKSMVGDYPKFYKMDLLSKIGFLGCEGLLQQVQQQHPDWHIDLEQTAVIIANRYASIKNDKDYNKTIQDKANYYPSPALFVYTLPNIVLGELAIRHHLYGETACYILDNQEQLNEIAHTTLPFTHATQAIVGWVECTGDTEYIARITYLINQ